MLMSCFMDANFAIASSSPSQPVGTVTRMSISDQLSRAQFMSASRVPIRLAKMRSELPENERMGTRRCLHEHRWLPQACIVVFFVVLLCEPHGVGALFGFGGRTKKTVADSDPLCTSSSKDEDLFMPPQEEIPGDVLPPSSLRDPFAGRGSPWEDEQTGEAHVIRATRDPYGLWKFPEGTVIPKDPTSMDRFVTLSNALGESFRCMIPARRKPANAEWLDVPQVPVLQAIDTAEAEKMLSALEGKCFYRLTEYWTYEFCYQSHVRQFRRDPNTKKIIAEHVIGRYNSSRPFEVYSAPDRTDHTLQLDQEGPAWTTGLVTVYGDGEPADQLGRGWYQGQWQRLRLLGLLPIPGVWMTDPYITARPRQVSVKFKCLRIEDDAIRPWLHRSAMFLDNDHVPFDIQVWEPAEGLYEIQLRSEALCAQDLLYAESSVELAPFGDLEETVLCQSESTGKVFKLKDVPNDDRFFERFKQAATPFHK